MEPEQLDTKDALLCIANIVKLISRGHYALVPGSFHILFNGIENDQELGPVEIRFSYRPAK